MELKGKDKGLTEGTSPAAQRCAWVSDAQRWLDAAATDGHTRLVSCRGKCVVGFDL